MSASALVVRQPFGGYNAGDLITDPATISAILASDNAGYVVATAFGNGAGAINNVNASYRLVTSFTGSVQMNLFNKDLEVALITPVAVPISLPHGAPVGFLCTIKDGLGAFAAYPATVTDPDGKLIDGLASFKMNNANQETAFEFNGTGWRIH